VPLAPLDPGVPSDDGCLVSWLPPASRQQNTLQNLRAAHDDDDDDDDDDAEVRHTSIAEAVGREHGECKRPPRED